MNVNLLSDIINTAGRGAALAAKHNVAPSYVSGLKSMLFNMKYVPVMKVNGIVCTRCGEEFDTLNWHNSRGLPIAIVCWSCNVALRGSDTIDGAKVNPHWQGNEVPREAGQAQDPRAMACLKFLNEFFKGNAEYLFDNPKIRQEIQNNAATFAEVEKLCQA